MFPKHPTTLEGEKYIIFSWPQDQKSEFFRPNS